MAAREVFFVIRSLSELLVHDARHTPELRGRIEAIRVKLRKLQSIFQIAETRKEKRIRNWIAKTREVAYDVEDILLAALLFSRKEAGSRRRRRYSTPFSEATNLHRIEPQIQLVEAKLSAIESDVRVKNIDPISNRKTYSHFVEQLVGRLVNEDAGENYRIVSITGTGRIGKTYIANRIYNHDGVRGHFHAFAWAILSHEWRPEHVLQNILNQLEPKEKRAVYNNMNVEKLVDHLVRVQRMKRCLIMLDDVCDMQAWEVLLKPVLQVRREMNIKVLLTTRHKEIARCVDMDALPCYLYEHRHLGEEESGELLYKEVYYSLGFAGISLDKKARINLVEEHKYSPGFGNDDALSRAESFRSCFSDEDDEFIGQIHSSNSEDRIQGRWSETSERKERISLIHRRATQVHLPSSGNRHCATCFVPAEKRCSQCKSVRYCSDKCQIIHWRQIHKLECKQLGKDRHSYIIA